MSLATWIISTAWWFFYLLLRCVQWLFPAGDRTYSSLDHLALNVSRPTSEWTNMGNWGATDDFPEAGRALAQLLFEEAGVQPGVAILDVGHGPGDSLLLLREKYHPRLLHGVTTVPAHAARAKLRLREQDKRQSALSTTLWNVYCDDALRFLHAGTGPKYSFILALDCAYHFHTRKQFLDLCFSRLVPGGTVALMDLAAAHPYPSAGSLSYFTPSPSLPPPLLKRPSLPSQLRHKMMTKLSGVPLTNLVSIETYYGDLRQAGLCNISIKDTSHLVFPGFARFLKQYGSGDEAAWRGGGAMQATALRAFGSVVDGWGKGGNEGMLRSVLVIAKKGV